MQIFFKKSFIILADLISIIISILLVRVLDIGLNFIPTKQDLNFILITAGLYSILWFILKENKNVYRYFSNKNLIEHFLKCFLSYLIAQILMNKLDTSIIKDTCLLAVTSTFFISIYRNLIKYSQLSLKNKIKKNQNFNKINILIYGAGEAGMQLEESLRNHTFYNVIGFIDDNKSIQGRVINKKNVYAKHNIEFLKEKFEIKGVIFAMPSIGNDILKEHSRFCLDLKLFVTKVPSIKSLIHGFKKINEFKLFDSDDLLSREEVNHTYKEKINYFKGCVVAVTGAGGSIGFELCKQLMELNVKKIVIIDNHEYSLFKLNKYFENYFSKYSFVSYLLDIRDKIALESIFTSNKVDIVYHAAAYKHVEMLQTNVCSAVYSNIIGTYNILTAAKNTNVKKFVLISTDKAVNPSNIMGATKRFAEIIVSSKSKPLSKNHTLNTCIVRFGNVLGSKGSVIPILTKQIEQGGPVTITDPKAKRYFMTIKEAVQLVLLASDISSEHRTYILEMGKQKYILQLAKELILMNGLIPVLRENKKYGEMNIIFTGLKKGEKLEEKLFISNNLYNTKFEKIKFIKEPTLNETRIDKIIDNLIFDLQQQNVVSLKKTLKKYTGLKD